MSRTNEPLIIKYSSRIKIYLGDNAKIWSKTFPSTWKISKTLPNFSCFNLFHPHQKSATLLESTTTIHRSRVSISLRDSKKKKIDLWIISRFSSTPSFEPTQSRTFPTEGNFCIHSPRVEGQEVRREEEEEEGGVDRESASNEIDFPLIRLARVHTRDWAPWGGSQWWIKKKKKKFRIEFDAESTAEPCSTRFAFRLLARD